MTLFTRNVNRQTCCRHVALRSNRATHFVGTIDHFAVGVPSFTLHRHRGDLTVEANIKTHFQKALVKYISRYVSSFQLMSAQIKEVKCKPSAETRVLAREGFHVSKVEEDRPTQPSVKGCRRGKHATKRGTSFAVDLHVLAQQ